MKKAVGIAIGFGLFFFGIWADAAILHDQDLVQVPVPIYALVFIAVGIMFYTSFKKGAAFGSPHLFSESHRLPRFNEGPGSEVRIVHTGSEDWAVVPAGGYEYLKAYLTSGKNISPTKGGVAILPARLLEEISDRYLVAHTQFVELDQDSLKHFRRLLAFRAVFDTFESLPAKLYFGYGSKTLHTDADDFTEADVSAVAKSLSTTESEFARIKRQLDIARENDLRRLDKARGKAELSRAFVKVHDEEEEQ